MALPALKIKNRNKPGQEFSAQQNPPSAEKPPCRLALHTDSVQTASQVLNQERSWLMGKTYKIEDCHLISSATRFYMEPSFVTSWTQKGPV